MTPLRGWAIAGVGLALGTVIAVAPSPFPSPAADPWLAFADPGDVARIARSLKRVGDFERALAAERAVLALLEDDPEASESSRQAVRHRIADTEKLLERPATVQRKLAAADAMTMRVILANASKDKKSLLLAAAMLEDQLETRTTLLGNDDLRTLTSMSNLALVRHELGELDESEALQRRAIDGLRSFDAPPRAILASYTHKLAYVVRDAGRYEEAIELYEEVEALLRGMPTVDPDRLAETVNSKAVALWQAGRAEEAAAALEAAAGLFPGTDRGVMHVRVRNNRAWLALRQGDLEAAEAVIEWLVQDETIASDPWIELTRAELSIRRGETASARAMFARVHAGLLETYGPGRAATIDALARWADACRRDGDPAESLARYEEAFELALRTRGRVLGESAERAAFAGELGLPAIAAGLARLHVQAGRPAEALTVLERGRGRAALDLLLGGRQRAEQQLDLESDPAFARAWSVAISAETEAARLLLAAENDLKEAETPGRRELLARRDEAAAEQRNRTAAVLDLLRGRIPSGDPRTAEELLARLPKGRGLLVFAWTPEAVMALVARDGEVWAATLEDDPEVIADAAELAAALRGDVSRPALGGPARVQRAIDAVEGQAGRLRSLLSLPMVLERLAGLREVTIVPDGPLIELPFELVLPSVACSVAPSGTIALVATPGGSTADGEGPAPGPAIVLGDPAFREDSAPAASPGDDAALAAAAMEQIRLHGQRLTRLDGTRREARAVARLLGDDTHVLLGREASAPSLRRLVRERSPRVLHLATHGFLGNARQPLLASIALATPDRFTEDDIGFLTLDELISRWRGRLAATELVTLSACDTSSGIRRGGTTLALPLGFLASGARTIVAGQWPVDDQATALLMARFYENWLGATDSIRKVDERTYPAGTPMPKLSALREAQRWLRELAGDEVQHLTGRTERMGVAADVRPYAHPYFWSGFVLHGDGGP